MNHSPAHPDIIGFAERLINLLDQGTFVATYKYAVLLGLLDLCLEFTQKDGSAPDMLTTRQLAEKVVELYWPQTMAYSGITLRQNMGQQARIIKDILQFRNALPDFSLPLFQARQLDPCGFDRLVQQVEWTLILMPLPRLQIVGRENSPVLYQIGWDLGIKKRKGIVLQYQNTGSGPFDNRILLNPEVGEFLVRLNGLLRPLIHRAWITMVARMNLLEESRLEAFLFGVDRTSLASIRPDLIALQKGCCFYCQSRLSSRVEVDHFIPWARYPDNGIENLVVSDQRCNSAKRDFIAASEHLRRWVERNHQQCETLESIAAKHVWERHVQETTAVAKGIYLRLPPRTLLWEREKIFQSADPNSLRSILCP